MHSSSASSSSASVWSMCLPAVHGCDPLRGAIRNAHTRVSSRPAAIDTLMGRAVNMGPERGYKRFLGIFCGSRMQVPYARFVDKGRGFRCCCPAAVRVPRPSRRATSEHNVSKRCRRPAVDPTAGTCARANSLTARRASHWRRCRCHAHACVPKRETRSNADRPAMDGASDRSTRDTRVVAWRTLGITKRTCDSLHCPTRFTYLAPTRQRAVAPRHLTRRLCLFLSRLKGADDAVHYFRGLSTLAAFSVRLWPPLSSRPDCSRARTGRVAVLAQSGGCASTANAVVAKMPWPAARTGSDRREHSSSSGIAPRSASIAARPVSFKIATDAKKGTR